MRGRVLERFRNNASYSQILLFDKFQKLYAKGEVTREEVYLFVVFSSATIVKNEAIKEMLR